MKKLVSNPCWHKKVAVFLSLVCLLVLMTGCGSSVNLLDKAAVVETLTTNTEAVQSVQTSITFFMEGQYYDYNENGEAISTDLPPHRASIDSKIDIYSSFNPLAFRSESFSNITVDGATTQEVRYGYTVRSDSRYIDYESINSEEEWSKTLVSRPSELSLPKRTGLICDWKDFMTNLEYVETIVNNDQPSIIVYSGRISSTILQEIFANRIFDDFVSNVEWVLNETVPCTLYLSDDTFLPQSFELDLTNEFVTHDVNFSEAKVTVSYSNWNQLGNITVPKKVSVLAEDHSAAVYSGFSARDLFIPYEPEEPVEAEPAPSTEEVTQPIEVIN